MLGGMIGAIIAAVAQGLTSTGQYFSFGPSFSTINGTDVTYNPSTFEFLAEYKNFQFASVGACADGNDITGLDSSPEMLDRARRVLPTARFELSGVEHWEPDGPPDLLFSNAALHWVGDHSSLFPRLLDSLSPGGVLAVQMPGNFEAPSHRLIRELAAAPAWAEMLTEARQIATGRMAKNAEELGADAVVGMRYASASVMQGAAEVIAYGTAVRFV